MSKKLLQTNEVVGRYRVTGAMLGEGSFSEVYPAEDCETKQQLAIKLERNVEDRTVLASELKALEGLQGLPSVCRLFDSGLHRCRDKKDRQFIAMELVGPTVSELRKARGSQRFSKATTFAVGIRMLQALKEVHEAGFVHRDVKPANFTLGHDADARRLMVIDFGLTRRYKDDHGKLLEQRAKSAFRGSSKYASVYTHQCEDQGRRDDIWSLFYVLVECIDALPWTEARLKARSPFLAPAEPILKEATRGDKEGVLRMKLDCMDSPMTHTSKTAMPTELVDMVTYLKTLQFADQPDYTRIHNLLLAGLSTSIELDWETPTAVAVPGLPTGGPIRAAAAVHETPSGVSLKRGPALDLQASAKRLHEQPNSQLLVDELSRVASSPKELSSSAFSVLEGMLRLQPREVVLVIGNATAAISRSQIITATESALQRVVSDVAEMVCQLRDRLLDTRPRRPVTDAAYR